MSRGTDRSKGFGAGGALEVSDVRLVEDGGERSGTLGSDLVVVETADEGRSGGDESLASMSTGNDTKGNTLGRRRTSGW